MILWRPRAALVLLLSILPVACSTTSAPKPPDPETMLEAIPAADAAHYEGIQDMRKWRNPYLIVRTDGVALLDSADSAEIILKTGELLPALAGLPSSKWPYGRVVAVAENGAAASEQDSVALRRNKGIVGGVLESAHIAVKWVPGG